MQKTLIIRNDIGELATINRFVEKTGEELGLSTAFIMSLNLVMEEAVSNIIFYAYEDRKEGEDIYISLKREDKILTVSLTDTGKRFDPTMKEDPDISLSAEERPIGGLGIYLMKQIMDEVNYQRKDNQNILIMKKKITE